jgi:hypothetical protein
MAVNISEFISTDLTALHGSYRGVGGYLAGAGNLDATDAGTGSGMRRIQGALSVPVAVSSPTFVSIPGDGGNIGKLRRKSTADVTFELQTSPRDLVWESMVQGTTVYALGDWDMGVLGGNNKALKDMTLLAHRPAASKEASSENSTGYENLLIMSALLDAIGDDGFGNQDVGISRFAGTMQMVTKLPWGVTVLAASGVQTGEVFGWFSEYPTMLECFVADGIIVAIPLTYAPVTAAKTKVFNFTTGAAMTVSSVNVGSKTATISAAGTDEDILCVVYETTDLS